MADNAFYNAERYPDPTAYYALRNIEKENRNRKPKKGNGKRNEKRMGKSAECSCRAGGKGLPQRLQKAQKETGRQSGP